MIEKTKRGLRALEAALLLGVLGDGLFRATHMGLNVLLWMGALVVALVVLLEPLKRRRALAGGGHWLLISALLFAAAFAWRDSPILNFLAGLGVMISLGLMAWRARGGRIWLAGIGEYLVGMLVAGASAFLAGFPMLMLDVRWKEMMGAGLSRQTKAALRGLLIAVPVLAIFGALFVAADARFERMVNRVFMLDTQNVFGHVVLTLVLTWIVGGFLRGLLFGREVKIVNGRAILTPSSQALGTITETLGLNITAAHAPAVMSEPVKPRPLSLGIMEIGITLGLLNLLFLVFVLLQLRYFFGGASVVLASDGMTFSEYYRRGFFELVTVAVLVLPLLLSAHWLLRKESPKHERVFRLLAGTQVALLFVIMTSAVRRMLLYQTEYGLTEQRLYTTAFMVWLALVFVWFVATVLRGRREQFACGALVAGLLVIAALHLMNPDAFIVRVNVRHAQAGRSFDASYATTLSADAVPALLEALPTLGEESQRRIATGILNRPPTLEGADWRSWNWSRSHACRAVQARLYELRELRYPPDGAVVEAPPPPVVSHAGVETASEIKTVAERPSNLQQAAKPQRVKRGRNK